MRSVEEFEAVLVARLQEELPGDLSDEGDLERRFVLPRAYDLMKQSQGIRVYGHPWKQPETCAPNCAEGRSLVTGAKGPHGCRKCWKESKSWAAVHMYGTVNSFDLVASDGRESLALEVKLLRRPRRAHVLGRANGEFQRLIGQCILARLIHARSLAFCVAEEGALDLSTRGDREIFRKLGIRLVTRALRGT